MLDQSLSNNIKVTAKQSGYETHCLAVTLFGSLFLWIHQHLLLKHAS
ncbi:hypothetical protein Nizo2766_1596 [Lactiplantibacillus plantarum]|nr:hypothetical protein Nizo1838_2276 [Lactiplantibacillus plantarum]KZT91516.1 hypothetical protein Nizo2256_0524 [Lactiplantibacillus plantarum]KZU45167.1 hypothetical protein Nizo2766_1596 [Lactiplantibacillus plantarum]